MAAFAHHDIAGLHLVGHVDDLLRREADDNFCFDFNVLLLGEYSNRDIALLILLSPLIDDRMVLGTLGISGGRITEMTKSFAFMSPATLAKTDAEGPSMAFRLPLESDRYAPGHRTFISPLLDQGHAPTWLLHNRRTDFLRRYLYLGSFSGPRSSEQMHPCALYPQAESL